MPCFPSWFTLYASVLHSLHCCKKDWSSWWHDVKCIPSQSWGKDSFCRLNEQAVSWCYSGVFDYVTIIMMLTGHAIQIKVQTNNILSRQCIFPHMNSRCRIESLETIYLKILYLSGKVYLKILRREVYLWVFITWLEQFLWLLLTWLRSWITFISFHPQGGLAKITHGQPDGMFTLLNDVFLFVCLSFFFFTKKNWKSNHSKLQLMRFVLFTFAQTTTMVLY